MNISQSQQPVTPNLYEFNLLDKIDLLILIVLRKKSQKKQNNKIYFIPNINESGIMSYKQFQTQFGHLAHRPKSPKLQQSSQQNNSSSNYSRQSIRGHFDVQQFNLIHKENSVLREENQALRRELRQVKKEGMLNNGSHQGLNGMNDLRETIKKEAGQIKELKMRLEVLSRQCKMYEQIIDKMQGKINKLTEQNKTLEAKNQELSERKEWEKDPKKEKFQSETLRERVNQIMSKFDELEIQAENNQIEWTLYRQQWNRQKTYYLHRIKDLQILMGIGTDISSEFERKKH